MRKLAGRISLAASVAAVSAAPMFAQTTTGGDTMPDPTTTVTAVTAIAAACGTVAAAILAWKVGSRLVGKLVK